MKPTHPQHENSPAPPIQPTKSVDLVQEAEARQDRSRRLHNARASQRAARHHRINRASAI
jgi:hypothetical protein